MFETIIRYAVQAVSPAVCHRSVTVMPMHLLDQQEVILIHDHAIFCYKMLVFGQREQYIGSKFLHVCGCHPWGVVQSTDQTVG